MPAISVVESREAIQYTGSNSAEIDSVITDLTIDSETGGVLTVTSSGSQFVVNTGDWIVFWQGVILSKHSNASLAVFYFDNALTADLASLSSEAVRSAGVASAPTLLLNIPVDVAVQLVPAMADSSYTASAYIFGTGVNLGQVTINSITVTDADTVTVNVQTSAVSLGGVHILVVAKD